MSITQDRKPILKNRRPVVVAAVAAMLLPALLLLATLVLVYGRARPGVRASDVTKSNSRTSALTQASQGNAPQPMEAEGITIRPTGFEPAEIKRDIGEFFLVVHNRSWLGEVELRLDQEAGNRLHDVRVRREKLDWGSPLDLHPGRYVLTEANHPGWACHIIVTAR